MGREALSRWLSLLLLAPFAESGLSAQIASSEGRHRTRSGGAFPDASAPRPLALTLGVYFVSKSIWYRSTESCPGGAQFIDRLRELEAALAMCDRAEQELPRITRIAETIAQRHL